MEAIRDIIINLLSDAIWALGGFLFAALYLKKNLLMFGRNQDSNILHTN